MHLKGKSAFEFTLLEYFPMVSSKKVIRIASPKLKVKNSNKEEIPYRDQKSIYLPECRVGDILSWILGSPHKSMI